MDIVRWLPWSGEAFARARDEDRPVLLSITTAWCEACGEMSHTTYADPVIASFINDHFVPIRVDADRRPDISERYTLGAWPTTAFLTAEGEVVGGGTFIDRARMPSILDRVIDAFKTRRGELTSAIAIGSPPSVQAAAVPHDLEAYVFETFDADYGGFGLAPKFPLTSPLDLALMRYRQDDDPAMARIVEATLDAMSWGGLYDDVDGGFYRCALRRDWQEPRYEKLLEVNAGMLRTLVDATVTRWGGALPQYAVGHLDRVARVRAAVAAVPGLAVCGAAYDGVGIPAVIGSATAAATQVMEHVGRRGTMTT